ncbi:MAG TPA: GNAT family N-acetyltransferase [Gemmatimonadaceae bacterium]|nr:GNAT family N-acetyltransferase [Gemmatimonadaceae bacterium]
MPGIAQRVAQLVRRMVPRPPIVPMTPAQLAELTLREATPRDLPRLAALHVATFNETHGGPFQSGPSVALREAQWRKKLGETDATNFVLVIGNPAGELIGFVWAHPTSEPGPFAARLNKIYLLRPYQRQGLGRLLMKEVTSRLLANGITSMMLFTETDNEPACRFYESLGAQRQLGEDGTFGGMYGWPDLNVLAERLA